MIFKNLPALTTLTAALIVSIITIVCKYDATTALLLVLGTAIVFFIIGSIVRAIFNKQLVIEEEEQDAKEETEDESDESKQ